MRAPFYTEQTEVNDFNYLFFRCQKSCLELTIFHLHICLPHHKMTPNYLHTARKYTSQFSTLQKVQFIFTNLSKLLMKLSDAYVQWRILYWNSFSLVFEVIIAGRQKICLYSISLISQSLFQSLTCKTACGKLQVNFLNIHCELGIYDILKLYRKCISAWLVQFIKERKFFYLCISIKP